MSVDLRETKIVKFSIPNSKGEMFNFTFLTKERWIKPIWEYDENGEPINVELKGSI